VKGGLNVALSSQGLSDEQIDTLIVKRADAKKAKDFAAADAVRKSLLEAGIILEDSPSGTRWRRS
jgi:cysteinyl-tRNA synthetase